LPKKLLGEGAFGVALKGRYNFGEVAIKKLLAIRC
jgi:hypothetical protein